GRGRVEFSPQSGQSSTHPPARPDGVPCPHLGHPAGAPTSRKGRPHAVTGLEQVAVFGAGIAAGTINTIVGSGTLITFPTLLAFLQPAITRRTEERGRMALPADGGLLLLAGLFGAGVYGGYFGAAQGVLLLGIMGLTLREDLQRINAAKNVLAGIVNGVAALLFIVVAHVAWRPALLLAAGSILGGQIGAKTGRRLPAGVLRAIIVVVGTVAVVRV